MTADSKTPITPPPLLEEIQQAAEQYGLRSFDNYVQIRSVAEQLRDGLCQFLDHGQKCVVIVPPQGPFSAMDYGSAAFSVSGKGFLPLEPISFGLAVKLSNLDDYMRLVIHCRKEGDHIYLQIEEETRFDFDLPFNENDLSAACHGIYQYLLDWFKSRIDRYDNGNYGTSDIGFDIQRVSAD